MPYQYHIECAITNQKKKDQRKRKLVVMLYILILLLVLGVSIVVGIEAAKYTKQRKDGQGLAGIAQNENSVGSQQSAGASEGQSGGNQQSAGVNGGQQNGAVNEGQNGVVNENKPVNEQNTTNIGTLEIPEVENLSSEKKISTFIKKVSNIYNGEEGKRVFLTFDDGPSKAVTPHILETLKKNNIRATFFVLGSRVKLNPDLVKREFQEGHYIANHGYSHKYSKIYASSNTVLEEYNKTEIEIRKALGNNNYSSHLFRFPGGSVGGEYHSIKKKTKKVLKEEQIAYLDWNALTNDAAGANTKKKIISNLKKTVGSHKNVVILMHDAPDKILTYETLDEIIKYLKGKGYAFKNMYDLM